MKKLFQNNLFKLPFFLLIVGVICTAALSIVNHFTETRIVENEKNEIKNACMSAFSDIYSDSSTFVIEELDVSDELKELGITGKDAVKNGDTVIGYVYIGSVQGFADKIKFVASYESGKFHKLKVTYEQESNKKGINYVKNNYKDYSLSDTNFFETSSYASGVSGASMTGQKGLIAALNACSSDYKLGLNA